MNDLNTKDYETGVPEEGPILPDRLTHQVPKGADHPTPFAKGTTDHDNTPSGFYSATAGTADHGYKSTTAATTTSDEGDYYYQPPAGWSVEKAPESTTHHHNQPIVEAAPVINNKRQIDDDSDLDFIHYEEFSGRKEGYVFRLGSKGIGYYADKRKKQMIGEQES